MLNRLDLAFSRDQHRARITCRTACAVGKDLYAWLENGAYLYVCGDADKMAPDVNAALRRHRRRARRQVARRRETYVRKLADDRRYLRDVY